jgi:hypothetical protein
MGGGINTSGFSDGPGIHTCRLLILERRRKGDDFGQKDDFISLKGVPVELLVQEKEGLMIR